MRARLKPGDRQCTRRWWRLVCFAVRAMASAFSARHGHVEDCDGSGRAGRGGEGGGEGWRLREVESGSLKKGQERLSVPDPRTERRRRIMSLRGVLREGTKTAVEVRMPTKV